MKAHVEAHQTVVERRHFDKIALIDADRLKYLVTYEIFMNMKEGYQRQDININACIESKLNFIFNSFSAKGYIFCFSGKSYETFRANLGFEKEYKGARRGKDDPNFYEGKIDDMYYVPEYISKQYPTLIFSDLEADDILSMLQNENTFIYSNDKDLLQVPGLHYSEDKGNLYEVSEEEAYKTLMKQLLTGDATDSIVGLQGCGEVNAEKIVNSVPVKQLHSQVLYAFQKKHGITKGLDAFVESWNLIKLRPKRGSYFIQKYQRAFDLLERLEKSI